MLVKLPWFFEGTLVTATAAVNYSEASLSIANILDPGLGFSSHQPRGLTSWTPFFNAYLVRGVSYDIRIRPSTNLTSDDVAINGFAGITFGDANWAGEFSSLTTVMETPPAKGLKWKRWSVPEGSPRDPKSNEGITRFKGFISIKSLVKQMQQVVNWPNDYWSGIGSSPTFDTVVTMFCGSSPQGSGASGAIETNPLPGVLFDVKFVFYVEFANADYAP